MYDLEYEHDDANHDDDNRLSRARVSLVFDETNDAARC